MLVLSLGFFSVVLVELSAQAQNIDHLLFRIDFDLVSQKCDMGSFL